MPETVLASLRVMPGVMKSPLHTIVVQAGLPPEEVFLFEAEDVTSEVCLKQ